jgi:RHS repeat-associated protein
LAWTGTPSTEQTSCTNPSLTEINETWSYDPTNGVGELGGETTTQGTGYSAVHTYNGAVGLLGEPATTSITIGAHNPFNYTYSYDSDNRPSSYNSPSGAVPTINRNAAGYIASLVDNLPAPQGPKTVWTANTRDAENHLTQATFGNGVQGNYYYDNTTGRQTSLITAVAAGSNTALQYIGYRWDQFGNLLERNDGLRPLDEFYTYDELNRLIGVRLASGQTENSFSYDVLGNMLTKMDAGTYTYPPNGAAQPHGVAKVVNGSNTTNFTYDFDGNLTNETGSTTRTLTWTLFNMPLSIKYKTQTLTFQYDADHNRVMQKEGATDIVYYLPDGEWTVPLFGGNPPVWHTYFEVDGERVAEATNPNGTMIHNYFHNDYQNSIGMITDDTTIQPPKQDELSDVFGQPRLPTGAIDPNWGTTDVTKRRYINQEDLTDAQLIDLNARVYDPLLAKFMSPDPIISDQDDSQSWNAYAYSHNNPMSKEDPTGLDPNAGPTVSQDAVSGIDLGGGVTYNAATNSLYVPSSASSVSAFSVAAAIQTGGAQAGAGAVSSLSKQSGGLSAGAGVAPVKAEPLASEHIPSTINRPDGSSATITFNNDNPHGASPNQLVTPLMSAVTQQIVQSDAGLSSMNINSTTGGKHWPGSDHPFGNAIDIDQINGVSVRTNVADAKQLESSARANPFTRFVCGPGGGCVVRVTPLGQFQGASGGEDHENHVHIGVFSQGISPDFVNDPRSY